MKYIYNDYNDLLMQINNKSINLFIREQEVSMGKNEKEEETFILTFVMACSFNNDIHISTYPVFPTKETTDRDKYIEHVRNVYVELCKNIKGLQPKINLIKGGVEE